MPYSNIYLQKIQELSMPNKYAKWYCSIIQTGLFQTTTRKTAKLKIGDIEKHHILPKSFRLGGEKDKENYVYLTTKEHFICHRLLSKMFSGRKQWTSMNFAAWRMVRDRTYGININSRIYQLLRKNAAIAATHNKGRTTKLKGKSYIDLYGIDGAKIEIEKRNKTRTETYNEFGSILKGKTSEKKGKTFIEMYGIEKARELSELKSKEQKGISKSEEHNKKNSLSHLGRPSKNKGKTLEEIHGPKEADRLREQYRNENANRISVIINNISYVSKQDACRKLQISEYKLNKILSQEKI